MTRLFTLFSLFLFGLFLCSCEKNDLSSQESALLDSACGVKDPVKELPWLKEIVSKAETGPDKFSLAGTVHLINYQTKAYFVYQRYIMSCMACEVYDCQGNKLYILTNPQLHMAIIENMSEKNIIYRSPMN